MRYRGKVHDNIILVCTESTMGMNHDRKQKKKNSNTHIEGFNLSIGKLPHYFTVIRDVLYRVTIVVGVVYSSITHTAHFQSRT